MGVFYKIKCALARWMYGRNGMDQLNLALLWGYIGICLVGMILSAVTKWALLSLILEDVYKRQDCHLREFKGGPCFTGYHHCAAFDRHFLRLLAQATSVHQISTLSFRRK